jgi:hypothetical protein
LTGGTVVNPSSGSGQRDHKQFLHRSKFIAKVWLTRFMRIFEKRCFPGKKK